MPAANPNSRCDIYVANTSKQSWDFSYRRANGQKVTQPIPGPGQIKVSGPTTIADAQAIMTQWAKYGLRDISEIEDARVYVGLVMSRGKPVPRELILHRIQVLNHGVLDEKGRQMRLAAGIATMQQIEENTGVEMNSLEMSIIEDEHQDGTDPTFATNITISKNADPDKVKTTTRRVTPGRVRRSA